MCIRSFPEAILHVDGDAFFASCEQAVRKELKGKPVVTGMDRGIASSMSYEAKACGVTRGMPVYQIRRICPECIVVPSDYELYSAFSVRMYDIVRRYTTAVEEYSIDECFANITGMRQSLHLTYEKIAAAVKKDLDTELGITFSVGLAPTKVLAKVASKWKKPSGLTIIPGTLAHHYLRTLPVDALWGIGKNTGAYLNNCGVSTALDFARKPLAWVEHHLSKPYQEIWHELRGISIYRVDTEKKSAYKSISKTRTFTPPSTNKHVIFSQLSKNIENACIKARRYNLVSQHIRFFLKTQDFQFQSAVLKLSQPVSTPERIISALTPAFEKLYTPRTPYRGTGVFLMELCSSTLQPDLFGEHAETLSMDLIYKNIDEVNKRYGKHTVFLGSSLITHQNGAVAKSRTHIKRKRLGIPIIGEVM